MPGRFWIYIGLGPVAVLMADEERYQDHGT